MKVISDDDRQVGYVEMRSNCRDSYERYKIYEDYLTNRLFILEIELDTSLGFETFSQKCTRTYFKNLDDLFTVMKKRGLFVVWEG